MASKVVSALPLPVRFGREQPCDYSCFEELTATAYGPSACRTIHLGCGDGRTSVHLAKLGYRVLGIDPERERLAAARERAAVAGVDLDLMLGDPLALPPLPEESFSLAVDMGIAADLPDGLRREEYFRRVLRLLMRNGVLLASAPAPTTRRGSRKNHPFAFADPFVSDITRAGFNVVFEGLRPTPGGEQRLVVHGVKRQ